MSGDYRNKMLTTGTGKPPDGAVATIGLAAVCPECQAIFHLTAAQSAHVRAGRPVPTCPECRTKEKEQAT